MKRVIFIERGYSVSKVLKTSQAFNSSLLVAGNRRALEVSALHQSVFLLAGIKPTACATVLPDLATVETGATPGMTP